MKDKIIFTRKISHVGKAKQLVMYIPVVVGKLVQEGVEYKVTLEKLPAAPLTPTEIKANT